MLPTDTYLDHVAVAVESLDLGEKIYTDLGLNFSSEREVVKEQGVEVSFAPLDQRSRLELLAPWGEDGPIHQFLAKEGPGIHHLCFRVNDILSLCDSLRAKNYQLLYERPKKGAGGMLVNFIHPKSTGGVLIELSQKDEDSAN